jgi:hypothetical protein
MDKPPDRPIERLTEPPAQQDTHLSDEILLLSVDGELAVRDVNQVKAHLEACWSCRARRDQVEESIAEVVEYRNLLLKPYLPPSRSGRSMFLARLDEFSREAGRPTLWSRINGLFRSSSVTIRRPAWISGVALVCILLLLLAEFRGAAVVSASEVITRSEMSEKELLRKTASPLIYQKLRIRSSGALLTRAFYRDPRDNREIESESSDAGLLASSTSNAEPSVAQPVPGLRTVIEKEFAQAHLNWSNPLAADSFQAWHRQLVNPSDEVTRTDRELVSIRTEIPEGPVRESVFTVRAADYHPVAERFTLKDDKQIEITETAFEVISLDAVDPSLLAFKGQPEKIEDRLRASVPSVAPSRPTPEQLTQSELEARLALHLSGADLGEQIEISRNADSSVLVQGLAASDSRKKEILAALQGVPNLDTRLRTLNEATAGERLAQPTYDGQAVVVETQPLLQDELEQKFSTVDERIAYVDSILGSSQKAMAHAWALRRLASRFEKEDVSGFNARSRQTLELLIRDHIGAIRQEVGTQTRLVETIVPPSSRLEPGANSRPQCSGSGWRDATEHLFQCLGEIQEDTAVLLAGAAGSGQDKKDTSRRVSETLEALEAQIPCLYEQVSGDFLLQRDPSDR